MRLLLALITAAILAGNLAGCVPVVAGGAAAGGLMAADRRTSGAYVEDEAIELKAEKQINEKLGNRIHANVTSYNRNVLITGEAYDESAKQSAESVVKGIENVRSVTNEVIIGPSSSISSRSNDAYLTSKVKARMVSENRFPANYVKVVTEDSTVYLMGMVTRKEAEDAVDIARNTDGVTKVVKVFEYVVVE
ncbi:MAG TPA: BON domain-containing protein [Novimethylophilus sp.]|jgi:osmotically-inducible protein OsmY|uniref:BON domain-containing protein n=1 Tax=Novimethylophilus sp. TaxID=2137426 RepID=UPI002F412538